MVKESKSDADNLVPVQKEFNRLVYSFMTFKQNMYILSGRRLDRDTDVLNGKLYT
jgi:hypothetical protein